MCAGNAVSVQSTMTGRSKLQHEQDSQHGELGVTCVSRLVESNVAFEGLCALGVSPAPSDHSRTDRSYSDTLPQLTRQ